MTRPEPLPRGSRTNTGWPGSDLTGEAPNQFPRRHREEQTVPALEPVRATPGHRGQPYTTASPPESQPALTASHPVGTQGRANSNNAGAHTTMGRGGGHAEAPANPTGHLLHEATPPRLGEAAALPLTQMQTQGGSQNEDTERGPNERTGQNPEKELKEMETSHLSEAEFKTLTIRMLDELGGRRDGLSENLHKRQ